ncbi:MAG: YlmC/YmxH family sporulation protein [Clostridia bacterium]|nr:YlmC/YmxH family sporulation protein [Clostridia bacterium]
MLCRITDMHDKEVINVADGSRLGPVDDVEIDTSTARLCAIIIHGRPKLFGLAGHDDDIVIDWKEIEIIGEETILVNRPALAAEMAARRHTSIGGLLGRRR